MAIQGIYNGCRNETKDWLNLESLAISWIYNCGFAMAIQVPRHWKVVRRPKTSFQKNVFLYLMCYGGTNRMHLLLYE